MAVTTKTPKGKFYYQDGRGRWHPTDTKPTGRFKLVSTVAKNKRPQTWTREITRVVTAKQFAKLGKTATI